MRRRLVEIAVWGLAIVGSLMMASGIETRAAKKPVNQLPLVYTAMTNAKVLSPTPLKQSQITSFDIILKPNNLTKINSFATGVNQVGTPEFKHFVTPAGFGQKFGYSTVVIHHWQTFLKQHGLRSQVLQNRLVIKVSGKVGRIQRLFRVNLRTAKYHANPLQFGSQAPRISGDLKKSVWTIVGLTEHNRQYLSVESGLPFIHKANKSGVKPGYTSQFTDQYHVKPLYTKGLTGKGQTVGIIAFEGLRKSNVLHFWRHEKADANAGRLKIKSVTSPQYRPADTVESSDETTMDAEYSGSVAPSANIRVYYVNNSEPTLTNFVDAYEQSFDDNVASSTSTSWGLMDSGLIAILRHRKILTPVYRQLLSLIWAQGAAQGVSNFIASGDAGAYNFTVKTSNQKVAMLDRNLSTADASDTNPWLTSVGGTSLPFKLHGLLRGGKKISITNKEERAWGTDYYWPLFQAHPSILQRLPINLVSATAGGNGGFSHLYETPRYQLNVAGVNTFNARNYLSALGQPVFDNPLIHGTNWGRNYPDLSADSDPLSGYYVYQKRKGPDWVDAGGTSIASPQYAGVAALINSQTGRQRMGFWNPQIYQLAQTKASPFTPLNGTTNNSNLYYTGQPGTVYNQATGLGVTDFAKLAQQYK